MDVTLHVLVVVRADVLLVAKMYVRDVAQHARMVVLLVAPAVVQDVVTSSMLWHGNINPMPIYVINLNGIRKTYNLYCH